MSTLLLCLAGPLQSWGNASRFTVRSTAAEPTRSGIIGMIAAAQGRRRTDPIEDLVELKFGVRVDQPGTLTRDFHTAHHALTGESMPLSERFYLADAVFLVGIEAEAELLEGLAEALRKPVFPPYLGRRSCPPSRPLVRGIRPLNLAQALVEEPWIAAEWFQRAMHRRHTGAYRAEIVMDAPDGMAGPGVETVRDVPISFDPGRREYGWRAVERSSVAMAEAALSVNDDDFMSAVRGG